MVSDPVSSPVVYRYLLVKVVVYVFSLIFLWILMENDFCNLQIPISDILSSRQ